jgi:ATP-dependent DNA helicase DinG
MNVEEILGPSGPVANRLPLYEERPQQVRMAAAVRSAIEEGRHLLVEAGTGVGKSFAYLVPVILRAAESSEKVLISTHTIALQDQLLRKDLPFLSGILPAEFSVVVAKGRANYLCMRRLRSTLAEERALFEFQTDVEELKKITAWADETTDGTIQSLPFSPKSEVWSRVSAEVGNCMGHNCPYHGQCHFQTARRRLQNANVVIANHALVFSDLALRAEGANLLPDYGTLVLDEAHEVESVAAEHLGIRVTSGGVRHVLGTLVGRGGKGLLAATSADDEAFAAVERARSASERLFARVGWWADSEAPRNLRVNRPDIIEEDLSVEMGELSRVLERAAEKESKRDLKTELSARAGQCAMVGQAIRAFLEQAMEGHVYWVDRSRDGRRIDLRSAPVRVGEQLSELLWEEVRSVILTSATLTVGRESSFHYLRDRLGLPDADEEVLGSPFDFELQAKIYLPERMPDPRGGEGVEEAVAEEVVRAVLRTDGRAFVLFTSYKMMDRVYDLTRERIEERGYKLMRQGGGMPRTRLLKAFREDTTSILFGTNSFWQGVDVPGEALSHVVITKLPFDVPDRPLVQARTEEIERNGGNAFMEYSLPRAVLRLKQGFGRLIRSRDDRGAVTLLDPRIITKRYGRIFLDSLPRCEVIRD